ncbi:hypothetical protein EVAR_99204_1 [Eumeta japonica]|uniref:Uncharacterized protein n=1 Tax=Eumeta variegata TaxID=151549 RepID=A0A4C1YU46_EUMVA|nr:hypothetical protein EVAR_99204_1 [Eumeta japonica]
MGIQRMNQAAPSAPRVGACRLRARVCANMATEHTKSSGESPPAVARVLLETGRPTAPKDAYVAVCMAALRTLRVRQRAVLCAYSFNARNSTAVKFVMKESQWREMGPRGRGRKDRGALNLRNASFVGNSERQSFVLCTHPLAWCGLRSRHRFVISLACVCPSSRLTSNRVTRHNALISDTESAVGGRGERSRLAELSARVRAALPRAKDRVQAADQPAADDEEKALSEEKKGVVYAELALGEQTGDKPPPPSTEYAEIVYTDRPEQRPAPERAD